MGGSNSAWGDLAEHDDELAELWDGYQRLPDPGGNDALDAFVESKNLDIEALVRIGARLAGPTVLAYAFLGGIKFRDMETGRRWASAGAEFTKLKVVRGSGEPSSVVIVSESETDAARLTILYPHVDIAVLPAGAKRFTQSFAEQLLPYDRVLVGLDNDQAGDVGAAKIAELVPQAVRFAPPEGRKDWGEFVGDPPPLPEAAARFDADPRYAGRVWNVRERLDAPDEPFEWRCDGLLADGNVVLLVGKGGEGKSWTSLAVGKSVATGEPLAGLPCTKGDRGVLVFDWENGERLMTSRLRAAGITAEMGIQPVDMSGLRYDRDWDWMCHLIDERQPSLVVIDPLRRFASGRKENDSDEMEEVLAALNTVSRQHAETSFLVTAHRGRSDESEFRGSSTILDGVDVLLTMSRVKGDPEWATRRKIHTVKCRPAEEPPDRWLSIRADRDAGRVTVEAAEPYEPTRERPRDAHRDVLMAVLNDQPQSARALAKRIDLPASSTTRLLKDDLAPDGLATHNGKGWVRGGAEVPQL